VVNWFFCGAFSFTIQSATNLPRKLGVFLKILRIPLKIKNPVIPINYRVLKPLDRFESD